MRKRYSNEKYGKFREKSHLKMLLFHTHKKKKKKMLLFIEISQPISNLTF